MKFALVALFGVMTAANFAQAACQPARVLVKENSKGITQLTAILDRLSADSFDQPIKADLNEILAKVDPRLVATDPTCVEEINGYILQDLPDLDSDLMFDLIEKLTLKPNHGFSILSIDFWQAVKTAQQAGLRVAWIKKAPAPVNGVYFADQKIIALNWYADFVTFFHELRHHQQAIQFDYRSRFEKSLVERRAENAYSGTCFTNLNRYFAELDASTEDLSFWPEYFRNLDVVEAIKTQKEFPALHLLNINLAYPFQVSERLLQDKNCLEAFKVGGREIWDAFKANDISVKASRLQSLLFVAAQLDSKIQGPRQELLLRQAKSTREEILNKLPVMLKERREKVRLTLDKLPRYEKRLWCDYSGAFKLMANCQEESPE